MKFPILTPILLLLLSSLAHTHNTSPKAIAHGTHARRALDRCSAELEAHTNSPGRLARRAELLGRTPVTNANPKAGICVLAPEAALGPFYISKELVRSNIREQQEGLKMWLDLLVVDVNTCKPVPRAWVDVWHCNSIGSYSGIKSQQTEGKNFLRGIQKTDKLGMVHLRSTLPGWYPERATHVHVAVHIGGKVVEGKYIGKGASVKHIGQFYFSEDILKRVDKLKPYSKNTVVRMRNANDQFFNEDSKGGYNPVASFEWKGKQIGDGVVVNAVVGVDLKADYTKSLTDGVTGKPSW